ncbi:MAG: T9SS type A sorting domain-containing protein [Bacteroidota bacterium]
MDDNLLYPNPTSGKLFLNSKEIKSVQKFDAQGTLILAKELSLENDNILDFITLNLKEGLFFISLFQTNENRIVKKIIYSH